MNEFYDYRVYGLNLSANRAIPGLVALTANTTADVEVWLDSVPRWRKATLCSRQQLWYVSSYQHEHDEPTLVIWKLNNGAYFRLRYSDGTEFIVDEAGTRISAIWPDTLTLEDTATYLLGPVLGLVLLLRGVTSLHASAIAIGHRAIALLGPAGAGKSTTAAAFAELGYSVLSDDLLPLRDERGILQALPGYPCLRLWPNSVSALYGSPDALPRLTPNWDKRYRDLSTSCYQFCNEPLPLAAIYVLGERCDNPAVPVIEPVPGPTGMMTLLANTYASRLLDKAMRAQEFDLLSRLIVRVPLRRVRPHAGLQQLSKLCEIILDDFRRQTYSGALLKESARVDHV